ncbi:protein of unknown function [Methylorubrum extorquens DM4]|uniref:Uncharacterized protein n=1 Tax=Methylorubrum extorquens (strain DSM 6343 / CIP 106787 / DM4) TaxID=661410 RepID=C7CEV7_METED|nr:protein of unknown function [Methylorubrum extorquens DM4]
MPHLRAARLVRRSRWRCRRALRARRLPFGDEIARVEALGGRIVSILDARTILVAPFLRSRPVVVKSLRQRR